MLFVSPTNIYLTSLILLLSQLLMFGFAFFILIAVSAYVANLAGMSHNILHTKRYYFLMVLPAFLTQNLTTSINTIETAVREGLHICAHPVIKTELMVAWPEAQFHFTEDGKEVMGMIADYENGKCQVLAIGWEDATR